MQRSIMGKTIFIAALSASFFAAPAMAQLFKPKEAAPAPAAAVAAPSAAPAVASPAAPDNSINISRSFTEPVNDKQNENQAVEKIYARIAAECDSAARSFKKKCTPTNINVSTSNAQAMPGAAGQAAAPAGAVVNGSVTLNLR